MTTHAAAIKARWRASLLIALALLVVIPACGTTKSSTREPWTRQTRREVERDWWFQNRYDDARPSAFGPPSNP